MDILTNLPEWDRGALWSYMSAYGGTYNGCDSAIDLDRMDYFLRYWAPAKNHFYKMFGNQYIVKRPITFNRPIQDISDDMINRLYYGGMVFQNFTSRYRDAMWGLKGMDDDDQYKLARLVSDGYTLASNVYDGPNILIPGELTVDGRPLQVNHGAKTIKMVGKIVKALNLETTYYMCPECKHVGYDNDTCACGSKRVPITDFELYRREHSLILNQKQIRGNLCLSIHPLDYITISDNACGWGSCMSWMEDAGDYRLGTIEMMNSPYIVVAYLESGTPLEFCGYNWNSKRWRQLVVITPELILGNKQYPYENDELQGAALTWMRELAMKDKDFGPYNKSAVNVANHSTNTFGDSRVRVSLSFSYMYNDIYGARMGFLRERFNNPSICYNLSGPAICTACGDEICYGDVDASWTVCRDCSGMYQCACCGGWYDDEPYEIGDRRYCEYCYDNRLEECEICGHHEQTEYMRLFYVRLMKNPPEDIAHTNWDYIIRVCEDCYYESKRFNTLFGEVDLETDHWGLSREVISIDNISDEGLSCGYLDPDTIECLKQIRDEKDPAARADLIRQKLY